MPMTRHPIASGFREQMVELAVAREFEPSAQSIRNWVGQADRDEGRSHDASAEREELRRLTAGCARSARYWQKPRPGLLGRPARSRPASSS